MKLHEFNSLTELQPQFIEAIVNKILTTGNQNIFLFLSGGSAIKIYPELFAKLAEHKDKIAGKLNIGIVDERLGSDTQELADQDFNSGLIQQELKTTLEFWPEVKCHWYDKAKSLIENYKNYSRLVANVFADSNTIKIAILGIGADGHTAGIKADGKTVTEFAETFCTENLLAHYPALDFPNRVTLTFAALRQLDLAVAILNQKPEIVNRLKTEAGETTPENLFKFPGLILKDLNSEIFSAS